MCVDGLRLALCSGELFAGCTKNITRQELVNELKKRIESGKLLFCKVMNNSVSIHFRQAT